MFKPQLVKVSIVVIGRNEGLRLVRCLESVNRERAGISSELIYVDSSSTDDSVKVAYDAGAKVIQVQPQRPTAALGRNAGWLEAAGEFVLFLDGDTVLAPGFLTKALRAMKENEIAVVWGNRREINPNQSVYVRVLDLDWVYPSGLSNFCGGDALMRREFLMRVGGFDETLIAGEEPELCRRLRQIGGKIMHIDVPMTFHDLAINNFYAYWKRAFRAGYAYAELAGRFRGTADPLWSRDSRRNLMHGLALLMLPFWLILLIQAPALLMLASLAIMVLIGRSMVRSRWKSLDPWTRFQYAVHSHFQQIPILFGQAAHTIDGLCGRRRGLIEYHRS